MVSKEVQEEQGEGYVSQFDSKVCIVLLFLLLLFLLHIIRGKKHFDQICEMYCQCSSVTISSNLGLIYKYVYGHNL